MSLQDRFLTAPQLQLAWKDTCNVSVSVTTVKSRLASVGVNGRIAKNKSLLNQRHRQICLAFAQKYLTWTVDEWEMVL